ncbi:MAG: polysaccharide deacetylase family protein [Nitrospirales bacterium]|nr:polysaccharide deacetylase family protein [Nitrospirales bacterium]
MKKIISVMLFFVLLCSFPAGAEEGFSVPILLYHRFGAAAADSMTVTTPVFESHLKYLRDHGYRVIPLRQVVDSWYKKGSIPPKSVAIVVDDGHKTVYSDMLPLVKKYQIPVTLFIYPSAISNASYAMTWDQLRKLKATGLFDLQGHTFWHPNFRREKKKLRPDEYERLVDMQLKKSKERLEKELGGSVDELAWPFGIFDDELMRKARQAGYRAAFTMERHHATFADRPLALPRYLMENSYRDKALEQIMQVK